MKNLIKISTILLMAFSLVACRKESDRIHDFSYNDDITFGAANNSFGDQFKLLWEALNSNYAIWDYEAEQGLDWDEVYETYYPKFVELDTLVKTRQITDEEFTALVKAVIAPLHDGHLAIDMKNRSTGNFINVNPGDIRIHKERAQEMKDLDSTFLRPSLQYYQDNGTVKEFKTADATLQAQFNETVGAANKWISDNLNYLSAKTVVTQEELNTQRTAQDLQAELGALEKLTDNKQVVEGLNKIVHRYSYMNIDDGWEAEKRNPDGTIAVNEKFPSMKALGDWLHERGLKFGIYSSPGDYTCGGYLGSIDHELQDAESYNSWGIDYLKYDWCGYGREHAKEKDKGVASYVRPYLLMQKFLRDQPRDIFYSLCQYGMAKVWEWGRFVDANSWRTTGDINDSWRSMYDIGFRQQAGLAPYAAPGHWNDPDMLIVGKVGWSSNLRDSRLTPDEQYTHITLWTLLASNMLIGCDIAQMDEFTINLLCNNEVNAINQDLLGQQADRVVEAGDIQIWARPLADGAHAIGIFNVGDKDLKVNFADYLQAMGIQQLQSARDLWRQKDLQPADLQWTIPTHGCEYIKVRY